MRRAESIPLIGCACCSCARGNNMCDMHVQTMRQSAAVRKEQQHVEFALRDKQVVTCCCQSKLSHSLLAIVCGTVRPLLSHM